MLRRIGLNKDSLNKDGLNKSSLDKGSVTKGNLDKSHLNQKPRKPATNDYEYRLTVPGSVRVPEIGSLIWVRPARVQDMQMPAHGDKVTLQEEGKTAFQRYNHPKLAGTGQFLDPRRLGAELTVRNWRPGDRFWPAHTKSPKKVKELLQKVAEAERKSWPVIVSGNEIVWMRGFPLPVAFSLPAEAPGETEGLLVEEQPLAAGY